jgi:hypothetical protein
MTGGPRRGGCTFEPERMDASNFTACTATGNRGFSWWIGAALVLVSVGTGSADPTKEPLRVRSVPTCLSISPFRALPSLGSGLPSPEDLRDQVLLAFRGKLDSGWIARSAGTCPEPMAILDIFQLPSDLVASADGPTLRIRLEWHHQSGQTEFFLPCPKRSPPPAALIAEQLGSVAQQMAARVELHSSPEGAQVKCTGIQPDQAMLETPMVLKTPPGAFSARFSLDGLDRRTDTVLSTGGLYDIHVDFRSAHIDPGVTSVPRKTWPWWGATAVSAATAIFFEWRQSKAQIAYSSLGAGAGQDQYSAKWRDLRDTNLLRNGFLGLTLVLGTGSAWFEWGQRR